MNGWSELRCRESSDLPGNQWVWQSKIGLSVWAILVRAGYRVARETGPRGYTGRVKINGITFSTQDEAQAHYALKISIRRGVEARRAVLI